MTNKLKNIIDYNLQQYATDKQWEYYIRSMKIGIRSAAREFGISHTAIARSNERLSKRAAKQGYAPDYDMVRSVPPGFLVKGASTYYDQDGNVKGQWVKSQIDPEQLKEKIEDIVESLNLPRYKPAKIPPQQSDDLMNAYILGDPHLNMYAWAGEVKNDWDLDIACERHLDATTDLVNRSPKANTGILCTTGDLFHSDSLRPVTPGSGHIVDWDGRLGRAWDHATLMIRTMIDRMLKKYQKVIFVCIRGNHSETLELLLAKSIAIAYENEPRVDVLDNTSKHMQYTFGANNIIFTHGDKLKDQDKANLAVSLFRKEHGNASFSHVVSGHLHHARLIELSGVLVEIFQVLATADAWQS